MIPQRRKSIATPELIVTSAMFETCDVTSTAELVKTVEWQQKVNCTRMNPTISFSEANKFKIKSEFGVSATRISRQFFSFQFSDDLISGKLKW